MLLKVKKQLNDMLRRIHVVKSEVVDSPFQPHKSYPSY